MANWNLSVELRGQGNDLVRTLRQSSRSARDLTRDINGARRELDQLRADSRRPVRIRFTADTRRLRSDLDRSVRQASRGQRIVIPTYIDATRLRRDLTRAIREASRGQSITIPVDVDTASALAQLAALRAALGDVTDSVNISSAAVSRSSTSWTEYGAIALGVLGSITLAGPVAAAAITASLPAAFAMVGAAALATDEDVTAAFAHLQSSVASSVVAAAQPIEPYLIAAMDDLRITALQLQGPLTDLFADTAPLIPPLTEGVTDLATNALPGLDAAVERSGPAIDALSESMGDLGTAIGEMFDAATEGNEENIARTIEIIGDGISELIVELGNMMGTLAANEDAVESLDAVFGILSASMRAVTELADANAGAMRLQLEAIEALVSGIALVSEGIDFLVDTNSRAWDTITGDSQQGGEAVASATTSISDAMAAAQVSTNLFGAAAQETQAKLDAQKRSADGLRESILALNDVTRSALDAQSEMEQAIDDAAAAAKENADALKMSGGELDLNSEKARTNYDALSDLAEKTSEAAAAARDNGASWQEVNADYERGRQELIANAELMGLNRDQAKALADQLLVPMTAQVEVDTATQQLQQLQDKIRETPDKKTVTVDALTAEARSRLEYLGFKVKTLPDGRVEVTVPTGPPQAQVNSIQGAINGIQGKSVEVSVMRRTYWDNDANGVPDSIQAPQARGSVIDYYASGGMRDVRENHVAQIAPAGAMRVWAEPETGGEAYIPLSPAKRPRSRDIAEETVRRLGGEVAWFANGGITAPVRSFADGGLDFSYSSTSLYTPSSIAGESRDDDGDFSTAAFQKNLDQSVKEAEQWNKDLATVSRRAGQDVADALEEMGADGVELTHAMATGSSANVKAMTKDLEALAAASRASLTDYTTDLKSAVADQEAFERDLATLSAQGYGDLATMLAEQGDEDAAELASQAARSKSKASAANTQAKKANSTLDSEELAQLVEIIAAIKTKTTGIHQVADTTGLGEDDIISVSNKARDEIKKSLGSRSDRFLSDLSKANKGLAYANGGILTPGIYRSSNGLVKFAEPETGGEAYIPLGSNKRGSATSVLADVAGRFGLGLTSAEAGPRVVVIRESGPTIGTVNVPLIRSNASPYEAAAQFGRQLRRTSRGGVAARG